MSDGRPWLSARMGRRSPRRAMTMDWSSGIRRHGRSDTRFPSEDRLGAEALAFTRDGRRLAVSLGFAARMIDVATGKEVRRFPKQPVGMNAVAVSPDGATVATTGLMIKLWDIATGQEKTPKSVGPRRLRRVGGVQPRRDDAGHGSSDHTVKLWDLATRRERMTLEGHTNFVQSVAFSPDGKSLASIGFAPELILWDAASGKRLRTWKADGDLGRRVRFSPDGRWVAAETLARIDGRHVGIWDVATGKQIAKVDSGDGSYMFTPDGKKLIFAGESGWSPRTAPAARLGHRAREGGANDRRRSLAIAARRRRLEP